MTIQERWRQIIPILPIPVLVSVFHPKDDIDIALFSSLAEKHPYQYSFRTSSPRQFYSLYLVFGANWFHQHKRQSAIEQCSHHDIQYLEECFGMSIDDLQKTYISFSQDMLSDLTIKELAFLHVMITHEPMERLIAMKQSKEKLIQRILEECESDVQPLPSVPYMKTFVPILENTSRQFTNAHLFSRSVDEWKHILHTTYGVHDPDMENNPDQVYLYAWLFTTYGSKLSSEEVSSLSMLSFSELYTIQSSMNDIKGFSFDKPMLVWVLSSGCYLPDYDLSGIAWDISFDLLSYCVSFHQEKQRSTYKVSPFVLDIEKDEEYQHLLPFHRDAQCLQRIQRGECVLYLETMEDRIHVQQSQSLLLPTSDPIHQMKCHVDMDSHVSHLVPSDKDTPDYLFKTFGIYCRYDDHTKQVIMDHSSEDIETIIRATSNTWSFGRIFCPTQTNAVRRYVEEDDLYEWQHGLSLVYPLLLSYGTYLSYRTFSLSDVVCTDNHVSISLPDKEILWLTKQDVLSLIEEVKRFEQLLYHSFLGTNMVQTHPDVLTQLDTFRSTLTSVARRMKTDALAYLTPLVEAKYNDQMYQWIEHMVVVLHDSYRTKESIITLYKWMKEKDASLQLVISVCEELPLLYDRHMHSSVDEVDVKRILIHKWKWMDVMKRVVEQGHDFLIPLLRRSMICMIGGLCHLFGWKVSMLRQEMEARSLFFPSM